MSGKNNLFCLYAATDSLYNMFLCSSYRRILIYCQFLRQGTNEFKGVKLCLPRKFHRSGAGDRDLNTGFKRRFNPKSSRCFCLVL